jgi:hypothetical protein
MLLTGGRPSRSGRPGQGTRTGLDLRRRARRSGACPSSAMALLRRDRRGPVGPVARDASRIQQGLEYPNEDQCTRSAAATAVVRTASASVTPVKVARPQCDFLCHFFPRSPSPKILRPPRRVKGPPPAPRAFAAWLERGRKNPELSLKRQHYAEIEGISTVLIATLSASAARHHERLRRCQSRRAVSALVTPVFRVSKSKRPGAENG